MITKMHLSHVSGSLPTKASRALGRLCSSSLKKRRIIYAHMFTGSEQFLGTTGNSTHLFVFMLTSACLAVDHHREQQLRFFNTSIFIRALFREDEFVLLLHFILISFRVQTCLVPSHFPYSIPSFMNIVY